MIPEDAGPPPPVPPTPPEPPLQPADGAARPSPAVPAASLGDTIIVEPSAPTARRILEALLFASAEPLPLDRLREAAGIEEGKEARAFLEDLAREYEEAGRSFSLTEVAGGWQMLTRPLFAPYLARLHRRPERARLSAAALETLAVIAYRQPVLRTDVERVRGVACSEMLRALMERDLVRASGRAEEPGSPMLYRTTARFLAEFGLRSLRDLPNARDLPPPPGTKIAGSSGG